MRTIQALLGGVALVLVGCGGSDEEAMVADRVEVMNEMAEIVEGVNDVESLEDAKPRMQELGQKMKDLSSKWEAFAKKAEAGDATQDDYQKMMQASGEIASASARMSAAMMKLAMNPELQPHMQELMQEFGDAFDKR